MLASAGFVYAGVSYGGRQLHGVPGVAGRGRAGDTEELLPKLQQQIPRHGISLERGPSMLR